MTEFAPPSFSTRRDAALSLVEYALSLVSDRDAIRLLDLGCGSGTVAVEAARAFPQVTAVALDVAPANVAAARAAADGAGVADRVATVCTDYMAWNERPFDVIVSDGVLHLIPAADEVLTSRLAGDLLPGGVMVATIPVRSLGNSLRQLSRRCWRAMPQSADQLALILARHLHPQMSAAALAERIPYLRTLPTRLWGPSLAAAFAGQGLSLVDDTALQNPSAAKLKHHRLTWRKEAAPPDQAVR